MSEQGPAERLGLNVPYEWWPTSPLVKEIEASGFRWVQIPSPPASILSNPRNCVRHGVAVGRVLSTTGLRAVLHAPTSLLVGEEDADRVFEGALSYAAEAGAEQLIYHARAILDRPGAGEQMFRETRSLAHLAPIAERLGITIAIENLAPVYPAEPPISAAPSTLRSLVQRIGSPAVRLCLDVGHANVIAGLQRTALSSLATPVLDLVSIFHLHDNLGARWSTADQRPELDPLRLDLHLAPGRGTLAWEEIADCLCDHGAPLVLEVHPPHRPSPGELQRLALEALNKRRALSIA